jgi:hypothetical protein
MFSRALFPTDFSDYANSVLACLPELRDAGLREVVLLHVIRSSDVPMPETVNRESLERVRWGAEEHLNIARMALEGQGLRVRARIEYGSPAPDRPGARRAGEIDRHRRAGLDGCLGTAAGP